MSSTPQETDDGHEAHLDDEVQGAIATIFRFSLIRHLRNRRTWLFVILSLMPVAWSLYLSLNPETLNDQASTAALGTVRALEQVHAPPEPTANAYGWIFLHMYVQFACALIAIFYGAGTGSFAAEAERGSLSLFLGRPIKRWHYYVGKRLALDASVFILTAPAVVMSFLILVGPGGEHFILYASMGALAVSIFAFNSIISLLGLYRWALVASLAYAFIWELWNSTVSGERVRYFTLNFYQQSLTIKTLTDDRMGITIFDPVEAVLALLTIGLSFSLLTMFLFDRREFRLPR